jgi:hypothetical protein
MTYTKRIYQGPSWHRHLQAVHDGRGMAKSPRVRDVVVDRMIVARHGLELSCGIA